jgi:hypothetical protein
MQRNEVHEAMRKNVSIYHLNVRSDDGETSLEVWSFQLQEKKVCPRQYQWKSLNNEHLDIRAISCNFWSS